MQNDDKLKFGRAMTLIDFRIFKYFETVVKKKKKSYKSNKFGLVRMLEVSLFKIAFEMPHSILKCLHVTWLLFFSKKNYRIATVKRLKNFFATELENGFENWNFLLTIPRKLDIRFFSRHFIELYTVLYILYVK